jgi:Zn-dependent M16 (insulinase) family peptidase
MHGSLGVVRTVLSYGYLWGEIRVQGGAYGAGFLQRRNGCIGYYTYRDPDAARSIGKFAESVTYLKELAAGDEDITDYVIGAVGDSDILITPKVMAALSVTAYLTAETYEDRLVRRQQMINTSHEDIAAAAALIERMQAEGCVCVVGGRDKLEGLISEGYSVVEI